MGFCANLRSEKQLDCYDTVITSLKLTPQAALRGCGSLRLSSVGEREEETFEACLKTLKPKLPKQLSNKNEGGALSYNELLNFCVHSPSTAEVGCFLDTLPVSTPSGKKFLDALAHDEARTRLCLGADHRSGPVDCAHNLLQVFIS